MAPGKKINYIFGGFFFLLFINVVCAGEPPSIKDQQPALWIEKTNNDIGRIDKGVEFGWGFLVENRGTGDLHLLKAYSNVPGEVKVDMPPVIKPGKAEYINIAQDSSNIQGQNVLEVTIKTNDSKNPEVQLSVTGYVEWPVEILPKPICLIKIQKGETVKKQFTMTNNTTSDLKVEKIEYDENLFHVILKEIEKGKKFEIQVSSQPDAPLGEHKKNIVFHTNIAKSPTVSMVSWLKVLGRIYTNVQELDFGDLSLDRLQEPSIVQWTSEMVIINGMSTSGFKLMQADCDINFLKVDIDPVSKNNVFRVDVYFDSLKARKGKFNGKLRLLTNDKEFKEIILPVHGIIH